VEGLRSVRVLRVFIIRCQFGILALMHYSYVAIPLKSMPLYYLFN